MIFKVTYVNLLFTKIMQYMLNPEPYINILHLIGFEEESDYYNPLDFQIYRNFNGPFDLRVYVKTKVPSYLNKSSTYAETAGYLDKKSNSINGFIPFHNLKEFKDILCEPLLFNI